MTQSSFPLLLSSSSSKYRLVTLISLLLLNPLAIINGAPTRQAKNDLTLQRHKRQIFSNNQDDAILNIPQLNEYVLSSEPKIVFEGLLGCRYDPSVCNPTEACFDDELFGQCWDGQGSARSAFSLNTGVDDLTEDKLTALDYTIGFLRRYQLNWRDFMTQCILSHILADEHRLNQDRLENFYEDCLGKDEQLDEIAADNGEEIDLERRHLGFFPSNKFDQDSFYRDPYIPLLKSDPQLHRFGGHRQYMTPMMKQFRPIEWTVEEPSSPMSIEKALAQAMQAERVMEDVNRIEPYDYIDSNEFMSNDQRPKTKLIIEESNMNEPTKLTVNTNEGHAGLVETLQINNNKPFLPILTEEAMARKNQTRHPTTHSNNQTINGVDGERYFAVEAARGYILINRDFKDQIEAARLLSTLAQINSWPAAIFTELNADHHLLTFHVLDNAYQINASHVASAALNNQKSIENQLDMSVIDSGIGNPRQGVQLSVERENGSRLTILTLAICVSVLFTMGAFALLYFIKRNDRFRNKLSEITHIRGLSANYYQDLCRQRMQVQPSGSKSPEIHKVHPATTSSSAAPTTTSASAAHAKHNSEGSSTRSSTSSWSEEPVAPVNMDIMTGHLILSYMEDHLRNRHRLEAEWEGLCADEANEERASCSVAVSDANANKNRYVDCIPYDHTRIRLTNNADGDYINASAITDSDPKCKYIATQGPLPNTTNAFWQMVWEQGSCVIVALTRPIESGITMCHHYWPVEGSARFNDFEVNLVSEHIWSDDYLVRSFYLKNVQTMETRTVTQFHFLTWGELNNPPSAKALLDFRRKVNKCFRGRSSPIIVHCNDGVGRTGAYILLDIVLNRICKGAREINIAATLEHIRDQRAKMVKTKDQFEFVFVAVAEEVTHLLKAIPQ